MEGYATWQFTLLVFGFMKLIEGCMMCSSFAYVLWLLGWCYHWKSWRNYKASPSSVRGKDPSNKGHGCSTRLTDKIGRSFGHSWPDKQSWAVDNWCSCRGTVLPFFMVRTSHLVGHSFIQPYVSCDLLQADAGSSGTISNRKYNTPQPGAEQFQMQIANNKVNWLLSRTRIACQTLKIIPRPNIAMRVPCKLHSFTDQFLWW